VHTTIARFLNKSYSTIFFFQIAQFMFKGAFDNTVQLSLLLRIWLKMLSLHKKPIYWMKLQGVISQMWLHPLHRRQPVRHLVFPNAKPGNKNSNNSAE